MEELSEEDRECWAFNSSVQEVATSEGGLIDCEDISSEAAPVERGHSESLLQSKVQNPGSCSHLIGLKLEELHDSLQQADGRLHSVSSQQILHTEFIIVCF